MVFVFRLILILKLYLIVDLAKCLWIFMEWGVKKQIRRPLCPDIAQRSERCEWCHNMLYNLVID